MAALRAAVSAEGGGTSALPRSAGRISTDSVAGLGLRFARGACVAARRVLRTEDGRFGKNEK